FPRIGSASASSEGSSSLSSIRALRSSLDFSSSWYGFRTPLSGFVSAITPRAFSGLSQKLGDSMRAFSSASCFCLPAMSKRVPQADDAAQDFIGPALQVGVHQFAPMAVGGTPAWDYSRRAALLTISDTS